MAPQSIPHEINPNTHMFSYHFVSFILLNLIQIMGGKEFGTYEVSWCIDPTAIMIGWGSSA